MRRAVCSALFLAAYAGDYEIVEDVQSVQLADPFDRVVVDVESGDVQVLGRVDDVAEARIEVTSRWSRVAPTWDAAVAYCDALSFAFQDDWRLPSRIELVSLVDFTRDHPSIDPIFTGAMVGSHWTASTTPADRSRGYVIDFNYGDTFDELLTKAYRVRCVRGGS